MRDRQYFLGVTWYILSIISSVNNDIIAKYMSSKLHVFQIIFLKYSFSILILIPIIYYSGICSIKTKRPVMQVSRGVLLFLCITLWIYSLNFVQVTTASVIGFSIPIFTLILASFFLQERITLKKWLATIIGFLGVAVSIGSYLQGLNLYAILLIISTVGFAGLDILNKKFVCKENNISTLFYSSSVIAIITLPAAIYFWNKVDFFDICLFILLGASSNLILFFILKSYELVDATSLAAYKYLELIIAPILCYLVFDDIPTPTMLWGALIIMLSVALITKSEIKPTMNVQ